MNKVEPSRLEVFHKDYINRDSKSLDTIPISINSYKYNVNDYIEKNPSFGEVIWYLITNAGTILMLLYKLIKLKEMIMNDNKTTWAATAKVAMGVVALVAGLFGKDMPSGISEAVIGIAGSAYLVFSWIQGFFTKDKPVEPPKPQA